jgi:hypothetical protein
LGGGETLKLVVLDAGGPWDENDLADWADARLTCTGGGPPPTRRPISGTRG